MDPFTPQLWRDGQTVIEFETDGIFTGCRLKINGREVVDCMAFSFAIKPGGIVETTVTFEGAALRLNGDLLLTGEMTASEA